MGIRSAQRTMDASLPSDCSESLSDAFRRHPSRETESNTPAARCISRRRAVRAPYIPFLGPVRATKVLRQAIEQATRRGRGVRATITQEDLRHRIASIAHSSHT